MLDNSKKEKILTASIEEFSEYGFEKASTDRINQRAEVSKGLIFHYFGSKENLFMTAVNKCIDDVLEEFNDMVLPESDFISILLKMMEVKCNFFLSHPMHYKMIISSFYNAPVKLKGKLEQRYSEIKQIGFNIMLDIIKGLPLKKDVVTDDIVSIISGITNIVESKYMPMFVQEDAGFEKYYNVVKNEYIRLMNIVMYGMLDERN